TFGLLLVIFGVVRSRRASVAPFAVGAYIGGAYFFTSSTSFANPAVTLARMLSNTFAGIAPASAPAFIVAQLVGALLAVGAVRPRAVAGGCPSGRNADERSARGAVRLRPQRRAEPDGGRPARPLRRRAGARPLGGERPGGQHQSARPPGPGRGRARRHEGVPQAVDRRRRARIRRGREHGMRGRLPRVPGQALPRLEAGRPRRDKRNRGHPPH